MWLFFRSAIATQRPYRGQAIAALIGGLIPFVTNLALLFEVRSVPIDVTPIGFAVSGLAFGAAVFRYGFLDVVPVARNTVIERMSDGVVVLDDRDRIVDINPVARRLVGCSGVDLDDDAASSTESSVGTDADVDTDIDADATTNGRSDAEPSGDAGMDTDVNADADTDVEVIGRPVSAVLPAAIDVSRWPAERTGRFGEVAVDTGEDRRCFDVRVTPLHDGSDRFAGRTMLLRDVTERRVYEWELEARNERLDAFASVVSHDLRNPLAVAMGYTDIAAETGEQAAFEKISNAHGRMDALIDDVLALAREDGAVGDTSPIPLRRAVEDA